MAMFLTNPAFRRDIQNPKAERPWILAGDLHYRSDLLPEVLIVPEGYRTDFASVPWFCRRFFPQDGPWTLAAVVHDLLCDIRPVDIDSKKAAAIFLEAMTVLKVDTIHRSAMYRAVLWFGPKWS